MMPLAARALAVASVALACGAGAALAARTSVSTEHGHKGGPVSHVTYLADEGEANRLSVGYRGGRYVFEDLGAPIDPHDCEGGGHRVTCAPAAEGRFGSVSVFLRDGDDELTVTPAAGLTSAGGGEGDDLLRASASDEALIGTLYGDDGDDVLATERGGTLDGGAGADRLDGGRRAAILAGGAGADRLIGAGGNDELNPGADDDPDLVDGGAGRDAVRYSGRRQPLRVDLADLSVVDGDVLRSIEDLSGGDGGDSLRGGPAGERIGGGAGADKVRGGAGDDSLDGGAGDDDLDGGAGDDRISDWDGADAFAGGPGDDRIDPWTFDDEPRRERISCGAGRDVLFYHDAFEVVEARLRPVPADCELLEVEASMLAPFRVLPRIEDGVARWPLLCTRATSEGRCPTTFELTAAGAPGGRGSVSLRPGRRGELRVRLTEAGRRAARRGDRIAVALRMKSVFGFIGGGRPANFEINLPR
jgi:hypothetical protein